MFPFPSRERSWHDGKVHIQMPKLPLSVVAVICNEGDIMDRCLRSLADLASEILIVHDGPCTDASLEICRRYTDKIFVRPFIGDPGPHRVFAYERTAFPWIFQIDADEFLSDGLRQALPSLVRDAQYQGYEFLWPTWYRGTYHAVYHKRALVQKEHFYFIGIGQEYFKPRNRDVRTRTIELALEHKPNYDNLTFRTFRTKWLAWARLRGRVFNQPFATIPKYHCDLTDWEPRTRYRIRHPLLLGVVATSIVQLALGFHCFLKNRRWIFLKSAVLMALYAAFLYTYVWKYRKT